MEEQEISKAAKREVSGGRRGWEGVGEFCTEWNLKPIARGRYRRSWEWRGSEGRSWWREDLVASL